MRDFLYPTAMDEWQYILRDAIWQSTIILSLSCFAARFLLRNAAARAWILLLAMTACLLAPTLSLTTRAMCWSILSDDLAALGDTIGFPIRFTREVAPSVTPPAATAAHGVVSQVERSDVKFAAAGQMADGAASQQRQSWRTEELFRAIAIIWVVSSAIMLMRLGLSVFSVLKMIRNAVPNNEVCMLAALDEACRRVGVARRPRLLSSTRDETPMVLGFRRPAILVPNAPSNKEDTAGWAGIFTHELAHIVRHDGWSRVWVQFATALFALQPLAWVARRMYLRACEEACDDWVIATGSDPVDFAAHGHSLLLECLGSNEVSPQTAIAEGFAALTPFTQSSFLAVTERKPDIM